MVKSPTNFCNFEIADQIILGPSKQNLIFFWNFALETITWMPKSFEVSEFKFQFWKNLTDKKKSYWSQWCMVGRLVHKPLLYSCVAVKWLDLSLRTKECIGRGCTCIKRRALPKKFIQLLGLPQYLKNRIGPNKFMTVNHKKVIS